MFKILVFFTHCFLQSESYKWFGIWLRETEASLFLIVLAKTRVLFVLVKKSRQLSRYFCESLSENHPKGPGSVFVPLVFYLVSVGHYRIKCLVSTEQFSVYCNDIDQIVKLAAAKNSRA